MAASTRDVYLLLRAKDDASRVVRGFSANLLRSAAQVQAQALRAEAANRRAEAARMRTTGATQAQIAAVMNHARALENEARQVERNSIVLRRYVQQLDAVGAAFLAVGAGMVVAGGLALKFFYDTSVLFADYMKQVKLTQTQVDGFGATLEQLGEIGMRVARNIAIPFEQIQPALFDIFSSTNANLRQAEILLTGFAKAAVAGNTTIQNAARGTIAIMNAFNIPLEKVNDVLDIQFELVRKGVGTYEEFATKLGNSIPAAARAQQSFAMLAAMLAFMTRNGLSAAMASTSAARALEAMSHPKSIKSMEKLGIKVRDAAGNFLPLNVQLRNLRDYITKFPNSKRVAELVDIFKGAGGTIQARRFLEQVLLRPGELEELEGFLKDMQTASGEFGKAYNTMADSAAAKTQLLSNKWNVFKLRIGGAVAPAFLRVIDLLSRMLDWFDRLSPKTQKFLIYFALIAAAAAVVVGGLLLFLGALALIIGAIVSAGVEILITVGIIAGLVTAVGTITTAFTTAYNNSANFRHMLKTLKDNFNKLKDAIVEFVTDVKSKFDKELKPSLDKLWKVIDEKIIPAFDELMEKGGKEVVDKVGEALRILAGWAEWAFKRIAEFIERVLIPALKDLADWWDKNKEELQPLIETFAQIVKWLIILGAIALAVLVVIFGGPVVLVIILVVGALVLLGAIVLALIYTLWQTWQVTSYLIDLFGDLWNVITREFKNLRRAFGEIKTIALDFLNNAGTWLINAGKNIVMGLIQGILSMFPSLGRAASSMAEIISAVVPHSPAKKGPLSGQGSPYKAGQTISRMLAAGMLDQVGIVTTASNTVAGAVASPSGSELPQPGQGPTAPAPASQDPQSRVINNYWTINTQEIDPRRNAAELGWQLSGRM